MNPIDAKNDLAQILLDDDDIYRRSCPRCQKTKILHSTVDSFLTGSHGRIMCNSCKEETSEESWVPNSIHPNSLKIKKDAKWFRNCPQCNGQMCYTSIVGYQYGLSHNSKCGKCSQRNKIKREQNDAVNTKSQPATNVEEKPKRQRRKALVKNGNIQLVYPDAVSEMLRDGWEIYERHRVTF